MLLKAKMVHSPSKGIDRDWRQTLHPKVLLASFWCHWLIKWHMEMSMWRSVCFMGSIKTRNLEMVVTWCRLTGQADALHAIFMETYCPIKMSCACIHRHCCWHSMGKGSLPNDELDDRLSDRVQVVKHSESATIEQWLIIIAKIEANNMNCDKGNVCSFGCIHNGTQISIWCSRKHCKLLGYRSIYTKEFCSAVTKRGVQSCLQCCILQCNGLAAWGELEAEELLQSADVQFWHELVCQTWWSRTSQNMPFAMHICNNI